MRGVSFSIPNEYGQYLATIFDGINVGKYDWKLGTNESYIIENGTLGRPLMPEVEIILGKTLQTLLSTEHYYVIFADFKAFPKDSTTKRIETYEEFLESDCQIILLIVDCTYVALYAKNPQTTARIFANAMNAHFENIAYITDQNDSRTCLEV